MKQITGFVAGVTFGGILVLEPVTAAASATQIPARPVEAHIVWGGGREADPGLAGDVLVSLSDGTQKMWTQHGGCVLLQVARTGLVGWAHGRGVHPTQGLMDGELVIARNRKIISRIAAEGSFIDKWGFVDRDTCVVIRSRGPHGPSRLEKFRIETGKLLAECSGSAPDETIPPWARPFADGQE